MSLESPLRTIFGEALDREDLAERSRYLDEACGADQMLRQHVEKLLHAHDTAGNFLSRPESASAPSTENPDPLLEQPGQRIGRYKLLQQIGEGGCGVVYMAEQEEPVRRLVALKIIKLGMDTRSVIARFEAERQALAMMDHPNIAKVLDAGATETGRPYFVMELVRGVRITDYCDQNNLSTEQRLHLFIQVCHAVQHAHQKGIIHRDLKPSNLLVSDLNPTPNLDPAPPSAPTSREANVVIGGTNSWRASEANSAVNPSFPSVQNSAICNLPSALPKIIDFGIAKATGQQPLTDKTIFTAFEQFIGTPAYMSPEQAEMTSLDIDTRTDIYSLGVLLYELLTGKPPFDNHQLLTAGLDEMRRIIREVEPKRPSQVLNPNSTPLPNLVGDDVRSLSSPTVPPPSNRDKDSSRHLLQEVRGDLDWIVLKCLEKDRTRRYQTAIEPALDIERHLRNEPVVARPPNATYRLQKLIRRNKLAFGFSVALVCILVGSAIFSAIAYQEERSSRTESESARNTAQRERAQAEAAAKRSRELLYAADMNLASQSLQIDNLGRARRLLDRHRPKPGEPDLRGWEWRYLWQFCRSEAVSTFGPFPGRVRQVVLLNDGRFAVNCASGQLFVCSIPDAATSTQLQALSDAARTQPLPHSNRLLTIASNTVNTVSLNANHESLFLFPHGEQPRLAVSSSGQYIAAQSDITLDIFLYDCSSKSTLARIPRDPNWVHGYVHQRDLIFSLNEHQLIAAPGGPSIVFINVPSGDISRTLTPFSEAHITCLDLSPDGRNLVVGPGYKLDDILVLDAQTGRVQKRLSGHSGWISQVRFSPDGKVLASASADQSIRLWDAKTWKLRKVLRGHGDEVWSIAFTGDGDTLLTGGKDGYVQVWNLRADTENEGHQVFSGKTRMLIPQKIGGGVVRIDNTETAFLHATGSLNVNSQLATTSRWISGSSAELLAEYHGTNSIRLWTTAKDAFVPAGILTLAKPLAQQNERFRIAYSSDTSQIAAGPEGGGLFICALTNLQSRNPLTNGAHTPEIFLWGGAALLSRGTNGAMAIWETSSGRLLREFPPVPNEIRILPRPDAKTLLSIAPDRVLFLDVSSGRIESMRFERIPECRAALSPDGTILALGGNDAVIRIYDLDRRRLLRQLYGHRFNVTAIDFSPDGNRLASINGHAEALKLWDWRNGQELLNVAGAGDLLDYSFFAALGDGIYAGDTFGTWQVWRAPSLEAIERAERLSLPWPRSDESPFSSESDLGESSPP